jgi:Ca2+-binding EF-hand superfamily protein
MVQQMRDALFERRSTMPKMFKSVDLNDDGVVALEEFMHTLEGAGVPVGHEIDRARNEVTEEEAARLLAFFDRNGQGVLRYNEFMRLLQGTLEMPGGPSSGPRCRGLHELGDRLEQPRKAKASENQESLSNTGLLRQAIGVDKDDIDLHNRSGGRELQRVQAAFQRWDENGDGLITEAELLQVLQQLNPGTTMQSVRAMMQAADKDGDGAIDHKEFVAWLFA